MAASPDLPDDRSRSRWIITLWWSIPTGAVVTALTSLGMVLPSISLMPALQAFEVQLAATTRSVGGPQIPKDTDGNYLAVCRAPEAAENGLRLDALGNLISITVLTSL